MVYFSVNTTPPLGNKYVCATQIAVAMYPTVIVYAQQVSCFDSSIEVRSGSTLAN